MIPPGEIKDRARKDVKSREGPDMELRELENLQAWADALLEMKLEVEAQFMDKKAGLSKVYASSIGLPPGNKLYPRARAKYQEWAAGAGRFKLGVEKNMLEARRLLDDQEEFVQKIKVLVHQARHLLPRAECQQWHRDFEHLFDR